MELVLMHFEGASLGGETSLTKQMPRGTGLAMQEGELNRLTGCRVCDMQRSNERRYLEPHCHSPYKDFKLGPSLTS